MPKKLRTPRNTFKGKMRGGDVVGCCRLLGVWNPLLLQVATWSIHVAVNLQKTNVILCSATFYHYMNGLLKGRALREGDPVYFRLQITFFYKRCRASMTKHRQQSTKVKIKGTDLIWSQICSSLLHRKKLEVVHRRRKRGTSLAVQWLRLHASAAGGTGSIGQLGN